MSNVIPRYLMLVLQVMAISLISTRWRNIDRLLVNMTPYILDAFNDIFHLQVQSVMRSNVVWRFRTGRSGLLDRKRTAVPSANKAGRVGGSFAMSALKRECGSEDKTLWDC